VLSEKLQDWERETMGKIEAQRKKKLFSISAPNAGRKHFGKFALAPTPIFRTRLVARIILNKSSHLSFSFASRRGADAHLQTFDSKFAPIEIVQLHFTTQ
jgi:hypothetical protein